MYFHQWLQFKMISVFSQNQIFLSDGDESSNSHLQINYVLSASYINYYVQHYFWNCIVAYNLMIMVHQGEENAPCSATDTFLLTPQYWMGKFLLVSNLSRPDLKDFKGTDLTSVISWCLQWPWDGKKYLLSLGTCCKYLEAEMFMPETLRNGRVAHFYQLFLWEECTSSWIRKLFALSPATHHNISSLLFISKKQLK